MTMHDDSQLELLDAICNGSPSRATRTSTFGARSADSSPRDPLLGRGGDPCGSRLERPPS